MIIKSTHKFKNNYSYILIYNVVNQLITNKRNPHLPVDKFLYEFRHLPDATG